MEDLIKTKICFKCNIEKPLTEYYDHPGTTDKRLNKCKSCTRIDTAENLKKKLNDPVFVEKEMQRHRDKARKLNEKRPEKALAIKASRSIKIEKGFERHHWCYKEEYRTDIIPVLKRLHTYLHTFIYYDDETMMFRRNYTNELLDSKESHLKLLEEISSNFSF